MSSRKSWDEYFMQIARLLELSIQTIEVRQEFFFEIEERKVLLSKKACE